MRSRGTKQRKSRKSRLRKGLISFVLEDMSRRYCSPTGTLKIVNSDSEQVTAKDDKSFEIREPKSQRTGERYEKNQRKGEGILSWTIRSHERQLNTLRVGWSQHEKQVVRCG